VFVEDPLGAVHYVGSSDGRELVTLDSGAPAPVTGKKPTFRVLAIADDGSVGVVDSTGLYPGAARIVVLEPGTLSMDDDLRARYGDDALLSIEALDDPLRGRSLWRRASNGTIDGVPAGQLRVTFPDGRVAAMTLEPGERGTLSAH
jgi:hypothetical protein